MCVVGKNYRLQDIQLSKNRVKRQPAPELPADGRPLARPLPSTSILPAAARFRVGSGGKNLVENTGLEPVTSWLQTRRSPS